MYVLVHGEFREEVGIYFENMFETSQKSCLPSERSAFNSTQPGVASLTVEQEAETAGSPPFPRYRMPRLHDTNFSSNKRRGREGKEKPFFKFLNKTLTINKNRTTGLSFSPQKQTTVHSYLLTAHSRTPLKYRT